MADGRMIKRRISKSKKLAMLKTDSARLLYFMMYPHTDIKGRLEADPQLIRGQIIPLFKWSIKKIQTCLEDLYRVRLIILYQNKDEWYLEFTRFGDFQVLRKDREADSEISPPPAELQRNSVVTPPEVKLSISISKDKREKYGDFVALTPQEHQKLIDKLGKPTVARLIENLNNYIGAKGKRYKSHYHTILMWAKMDRSKQSKYEQPPSQRRGDCKSIKEIIAGVPTERERFKGSK